MAQGDILVMIDLGWVMYPPGMEILLWQIWHDQLIPSHPPPLLQPQQKKISGQGDTLPLGEEATTDGE